MLVHELGHFLAAKRAGVRVDEFGFGYPPRAIVLGEKWGTKFTLNWIPFGGFVKILGENYEAEGVGRKFTEVSKKWQAVILAGGVGFNILFAWVLFSICFVVGMPAPLESDLGESINDPKLTIVSVLPHSPADKIGLKSGDEIVWVDGIGNVDENVMPEEISSLISDSEFEVLLGIRRGGETEYFEVAPEGGIVAGRKVIGINMDMIGILRLPLHKAVWEGGKLTGELAYLTTKGIIGFIGGAFMGTADLSQVTGPVGIVGLVGDASRLGLIYLLSFTSLISVNLAIVNLLPFPALDGGRLLFVILESVTKKRINVRIAQLTNTIGFAILILLMLIITYRDILKLF